jgi:hypothetical protein
LFRLGRDYRTERVQRLSGAWNIHLWGWRDCEKWGWFYWLCRAILYVDVELRACIMMRLVFEEKIEIEN